MMELYFLRISRFRFPGRGLHDIVGEEVMIISVVLLFIFVPCLWLVRY